MPPKPKRSFAQERLDEARASGIATETPACRVVDDCGGCVWQAVPYERQLEYKRQWIERAYGEVGLTDAVVPSPIGSPDLYRYRNKMEFSFSNHRWLTRAEIESGSAFDRGFALGLHAPGGFDRVLDLTMCPIQTEIADRILAATGEFARASSKSPYNLRRNEGCFRYLTIRVGFYTGETLVSLVTSQRDEGIASEYRDALRSAGVRPTSLYNGVTDRTGATSENAALYLDDGSPHIRERLGGLDCLLAPDTFFQPNTRAAERIVATVREFAELTGVEQVVDLYCGVGALALSVASSAGSVLGVERSGPAVELARRNATANGIGNARFVVGDLDSENAELVGIRPSVVIVDPPRAGLHANALRAVRQLSPDRIVYVSCHPVSQAENIASLCSDGTYRLDSIQPVDQFPHTPHVECVARLIRAGSAAPQRRS